MELKGSVLRDFRSFFAKNSSTWDPHELPKTVSQYFFLPEKPVSVQSLNTPTKCQCSHWLRWHDVRVAIDYEDTWRKKEKKRFKKINFDHFQCAKCDFQEVNCCKKKYNKYIILWSWDFLPHGVVQTAEVPSLEPNQASAFYTIHTEVTSNNIQINKYKNNPFTPILFYFCNVCTCWRWCRWPWCSKSGSRRGTPCGCPTESGSIIKLTELGTCDSATMF